VSRLSQLDPTIDEMSLDISADPAKFCALLVFGYGDTLKLDYSEQGDCLTILKELGNSELAQSIIDSFAVAMARSTVFAHFL
jgi:hypothetical protein